MDNPVLCDMTATAVTAEIQLSFLSHEQKRQKENTNKRKNLLKESKEELFVQKIYSTTVSHKRPSKQEINPRHGRQMMATPQSPTRMFNGLSEDDALYSDAKYAHEINDRMRVPKRIRATGEYSDEDLLLSNQNGMMNSWNYHDKIDMNVPDRIVVLGHEEHLGTRSAPREILLENSILPKDPGFVRVATPPRVITLNNHHFPSASDNNSPNHSSEYQNDTESPPPYVRANAAGATIGFNPNGTSSRAESDSEAVTTSTSGGGTRKMLPCNYNNDTTLVSHREGTPVIGDLTPPEEILYLRRQLAKLNRRVLSIEIDNVQRSQREKIVYCMGLAYFLLKAIFWLNRN